MANVEPGDPGSVRWPIRWRLPLLICGLLLATLAAFGGTAYWELKGTVLDAQHDRLQSIARQLAALLAQSVQQRVEESRRIATHPSVQALVANPSEDTRRAAQAPLDALLATNPTTLSIEVWNRSGQRLLDRARPLPASSGGRTLPSRDDTPPARLGLSPLQAVGSLAYYDLVTPIPAPATASNASTNTGQADPPSPTSSDSAGFVVLRRAASSSGTADALRRIIGGTYITFGSRSGGVWSDMTRITPPPPVPPTADTVIDYRDEKGEQKLGLASEIRGTPWLIWVAETRATALAPANAFVARMIPVGLVVVVIGAAAAWMLARRLALPLGDLTHAAEAIANGELQSRVGKSHRSDEVGRLARAFNTMADRVAEGYQRLDGRVRERTAELEQALVTLKDTQEELVRREKLAMLGQLASGVGHELRNPLAVMTNAVYFLEMIQPDAPVQVHEYHALLRAQIGLSEKIVSDLLDFARIKPPRREHVTLTRLVDDQLARVTLGDNVRVVRDIPDDLAAAHVDPIQMGQVVLNLLVNAVQAMEATGGVLTLRGSRPDAKHVQLDVTDTGAGVPAALQEKIFDALFTTKARGIGLGLAVSRSLVQANHGRLVVSSPPGQGATFRLTLPIDAPEAA